MPARLYANNLRNPSVQQVTQPQYYFYINRLRDKIVHLQKL